MCVSYEWKTLSRNVSSGYGLSDVAMLCLDDSGMCLCVILGNLECSSEDLVG